jgi:hypothetical protein
MIDAWLDITSAAPGGDFATALTMAVGAELPLAALCTALAVRAVGSDRSRTGRTRVQLSAGCR